MYIEKITPTKNEIPILNFLIGEIVERIPPLSFKSPMPEAFFRFMKDENLSLIPVIDEKEIVIGQLSRRRFLEKTILGRFGYGLHLNARKSVLEVMEKPSLLIGYNITLEEASLLVQSRQIENLYDDIIVIKNDKYFGTISVNILLNALTQKAIILAKEANPLTGLPGNWVIQREIEKRISKQIIFDTIYIDINNFKPYNDHYGFSNGDRVIRVLGEIISKVSKNYPETFAGHIGGDDFIILSRPEYSIKIAEEIVDGFESYLPEFHRENFIKGYYLAKNRRGDEEVFPLLSLSCAIVSNEACLIESYAQLASIAAEVKAETKRRAKINKKSEIFKERRNNEY